MFRYFCYLYLVLPVAGNADIHNTGKCLALFSGNESDNSKQVENKLISLRLKQAWAVAYYRGVLQPSYSQRPPDIAQRRF